MRAQAELLRSKADLDDAASIAHAQINRHFVWLARVFKEGTNRHLFDGFGGNSPLRRSGLRRLKDADPHTLQLLRDRQPVPTDEADQAAIGRKPILQSGPTRISQLVLNSLREAVQNDGLIDQSDTLFTESRGEKVSFYLRSPLTVAIDYLTDPTWPASRAYVALTMRSLLFELLDTFPSNGSHLDNKRSFTLQDVEAAVSQISTAFRPRYQSRGQDTLARRGRGRLEHVDALIRHHLAMRGMLWLGFKSDQARIGYCEDARLEGKYVFVRSPNLLKLPDSGEIGNELFGLPIPIRGAETIFRGGLRFPYREGLVMALHGGPGSGKTSLALALAASLTPLGVQTLFFTAEETTEDLQARLNSLVPDDLRRTSFFPSSVEDWLLVERLEFEENSDLLDRLMSSLENLRQALDSSAEFDENVGSPRPCRAMIVLDGIHDLFMVGHSDYKDVHSRLRRFVDACDELKALVILTTGENWSGNVSIDYLVDVSLRLTHEATQDYDRKPYRRITLTKSRFQLSANGTHGFQLSGTKGVRFSPQINYQLDRRAVWRDAMPDSSISKVVLQRVVPADGLRQITRSGRPLDTLRFFSSKRSVRLPARSNIFINGQGSGGKAALALKIAMAPSYRDLQGDEIGSILERDRIKSQERILIISFLYGDDYYDVLRRKLWILSMRENRISNELAPSIFVIHLYPGFIAANDIYNRVEWELDAAEMNGTPYTSVVIDGIHNIFLQFPALEDYRIFWAQLYASLRTRQLGVISTHTTMTVDASEPGNTMVVDDQRSEPLRHALIQKTDFRIEVNPVRTTDFRSRKDRANLDPNLFRVQILSAIDQPIPVESILWSREKLVFVEERQGFLPFSE